MYIVDALWTTCIRASLAYASRRRDYSTKYNVNINFNTRDDEDRYKQLKVGGRADISGYSKYIYHLVYSL